MKFHYLPSLGRAALAAGILLAALAPVAQAQNSPVVTTLSPASVQAAGGAFTLLISGANFAAGATATWNGTPLATAFLNSAQLIANVPANLIASPGVVSVGVINPGGAVSSAMTFTILQAGAVSITTDATLPAGVVGRSYSQTLLTSGGTSPYRWSANNLPAGLILNAATGVLSGTPTVAGSFNFTVQVIDNAQQAANKTFTLTITPPPLAVTTVPPLFTGTTGTAYSQTLSASGGVPPYRWTVSSGSTGGLTLNADTGTLQGTPPAAGTFTFTVQVTDAARATDSRTFSVVVNPPTLTIVTGSPLPNGAVGANYSQTFSVTGGTAPYSWSLASGDLPGLTMSANGILAGIPSTAGQFSANVQVRDAAGLSATKTVSLTVNPPALKITTALQFPAAAVGTAFSQAMSAAGGVPPYSWSANGLPDGFSLNASTGVIGGIPAAAGSFAFTIRVTDSARVTVIDLFRIEISLPPPPSVSVTGLPGIVQPAGQRSIRITLDAPYIVPVSGQAILTFVPESGVGDGTIQFSTGGRSADFTIPAGATEATFSAGDLAIQTGTVAGVISISLRLQSAGVDITPVPAPTLTARVERAVPVVRSARITRSSGGFEIEVVGFCTAREVTQVTFKFSATGGKTLQSADFTVAVESLFGKWFQDSANSRYGSQFTFTQPFAVQGDASAVNLDSVTLTNRLGSTGGAITP